MSPNEWPGSRDQACPLSTSMKIHFVTLPKVKRVLRFHTFEMEDVLLRNECK